MSRFANDENTQSIDSIYADMIRKVLSDGKIKKSREAETLAIPGYQMQYDLSSGNFPLVSLKETNHKAVASELYCFMHGITDKNKFNEMGTKIWNEWRNPHAGPEQQNDLGPIYGYQWRKFDQPYTNGEPVRFEATKSYNENVRSYDQLARCLNKLKHDPDDRRMICSAWNPNQIEQMALPPCHIMFNLIHISGELSLQWYQRSCDLGLGVPFNIASYAMLVLMLCKQFDLKPGMLFGNFGDFHIYANHIEELQRVSNLDSKGECQIEFLPGDQMESRQEWSSLHWKPTDYKISNYNPHPKVKLKVKV